jgi:pyridoxal phosphate enzyme (YggS family)
VIRENLVKIRERIAASCAKAKRLSTEVTLVCVSKNRSIEDILEVLKAGVRDIAENKVQEALIHHRAIADTSYGQKVKWHMVGHLQTNKVKESVRIFDLIHSVDSLKLAEEIDRQAARINKLQDILIEVKTSPEESKAGISDKEVQGLVKSILNLKNLRLLGLMTMAPAGDDPEKARAYFRQLRQRRDQLNDSEVGDHQLRELSMGMSDDFQIALEEGATMVRIGRAVFEGGT